MPTEPKHTFYKVARPSLRGGGGNTNYYDTERTFTAEAATLGAATATREVSMSKVLAASAFAILLLLRQCPQTALANDLKIVNVMPAFERAWQLGLGKPTGTRIRLLKQLVFIPNKPAYDAFNEFPFDDVHLTWYLADVAPLMPRIHAYSFQLRRNLATYARVFRQAFPDFKQTRVIYFMPSLFVFDGQTSDNGVRFGVDGIVKYDERDENLGVLVDHELFHLYHEQAQASAGAHWTGAFCESLWKEGLATYVSQRLNPGSTEAEVLHEKALAILSTSDVSKLACEISSGLD